MELLQQGNELLPVASLCNNLDFYLQQYSNCSIGVDLDEIEILDDNSFVLISSIQDSKYNGGFVTKFNSFDDIPDSPTDFFNPKYGPCAELCVASSNRIFVGFNSGNITVLDSNLTLIDECRYFHNRITKTCLIDSKQLIGGDFDGRLVLINCNAEMCCLKCYDYAHNGPITGLQTSHDNKNLFISCGGDQETVLWDVRESLVERPSTILLTTTSIPTALYWPTNNELLIGTESGNVVKFDIRNKKVLKNCSVYDDDRILKFKPIKGGSSLAIIGEAQNTLHIYDHELMNKPYEHNYSNSDFSIRSCMDIPFSSKLITIGTQCTIYCDDILKEF